MNSTGQQTLSFLTMTLFFFLSASTDAQMIHKKYGSYYHNGEHITKEDLGELMNTKRLSAERYDRHKQLATIAKNFGVSTLIAYGAGGLLIEVGSKSECPGWVCIPTETVIGVLFLVAGSLTGVISLISYWRSKDKLKSAIDIFNDSQLKSDHGSQENIQNLNLNSNGIGLSYSF